MRCRLAGSVPGAGRTPAPWESPSLVDTVPVAAVWACGWVFVVAGPRDQGDPPGSSPVFHLQGTGDPGAVLWLDEIRQQVARANQDTDAAQRSKG